MNGLLDSLLEFTAAWLVDFAILATALLLAALMLRMVVRSPASRVTLAWGAWLSLLAAAVIAACPGRPRVALRELLPASHRVETTVVLYEETPADGGQSGTLEWLSDGELTTLAAAPEALLVPQRSPIQWIAQGWLALAVLAIGWLMAGLWRAWRLIRRSQVAPEWTHEMLQQISSRARKQPGLRTSEQLASAIALGTLRPRIVLPQASCEKSNAPAVRAALAHEWAHLRHGDLWLLALERLLLPLLAVHPLFWWLRRATRLDQELLADAAAAGDRPEEYAEALVAWAKAGPPRCAGLAALAMWERPSNLSRRVRMLLNSKDRQTNRGSRFGGLTAIAILLALVAGLSCLSFYPTEAQEPAKDPSAAPATETPMATAPANAPQAKPWTPPPLTARTGPMPDAIREQIVFDVTILTLNKAAQEEAKTALAEIGSVEQGEHMIKGDLLTVELNADQVQTLFDRVAPTSGIKEVSRPKIVTMDSQVASITIGGAVPVVAVEQPEDTRRKKHSHLEFHIHEIRLTPQLLALGKDQLQVTVETQRTYLINDKPGSMARMLRAVVGFGRTLVMLENDKKAGDAENEKRGQALIMVTPLRIDWKTEKIEFDPPAPAYATAADDDTALAGKLRSFRETLETLAREREQSRAENAALKQQLEEYRQRLKELDGRKDPAADAAPMGLPTNTPTAPKVGAPITLPTHPSLPPTDPQPKAAAKSTVVYSIKFHKAEAMAAMLKELCQASKIDAQIAADERTNALIVHADEQGQASLKSLVTQLDSQLDPFGQPRAAVGLPADKPATERVQAEIKLLELDLQAAEIDLQAAQEDLDEAQKLHANKAISEQELRTKRRMVERAQIAVARIKVQLEATQSSGKAGQ